MKTKLAQGTVLRICLLCLPALVARPADMDNPPRLINPPPEQTCVTNWCEVIHAPSGQMYFTNIVVWPEPPVCLGTTLYAIPIMGSSCDNAIIDNRWDPPSTNCPAHTLSTNTYCPYSITNWWVVSGPGSFQASGEGLGVAFTPTNCGQGSITFHEVWTNSNPCGYTNAMPGGHIVITTNFTVVNVDIAETGKTNCVCDTTSFTLTNSCHSVTWEVSPDEPGGPHAVGSAIVAGTNCGTWTVTARSTVNTNCTDSATLIVVKADSLSPSEGYLVADSDPPTYQICPCPGDVIVTANPCPQLTADQLPACWTFAGGEEIDRLRHKVQKESLTNGSVTFTVTAGCSTNTIILVTDPEKLIYNSKNPSQECLYDNFTDPSPLTDQCGNSLSINCVGGRGWPRYTPGHYEYRYNGSWVGTCYFNGGKNAFLYKTTKHNCRILRTWHLTQEPTSPTKWVVTKYDCLTGAFSQNCRTAATWDPNRGRPADALMNSGYPANSCENQGTPFTPCPPW